MASLRQTVSHRGQDTLGRKRCIEIILGIASKACADGIVTINGDVVLDHRTQLDRDRHIMDHHLVVIKLGNKNHLILYVK